MSSAVHAAAIGSCAIEAALPLDDPRLAALRAFRVAAIDHRRGLAYAASLAEHDETAIAGIRNRLSRRAQLSVTGIAPIIETGLVESAAFVIEAEPLGERLFESIARSSPMAPCVAIPIATKIASALAAAKLPHGQLSSNLIWTNGSAVTLSGFAFDEPAPGTDAVDLARLAFEMLSGRRFDADAFQGPPAARAERIRESLPGISASVANVISDGTGGRFPGAVEFSAALEAARDETIVLLVDAANQSLSLKDPGGADVFLDAARRYNPTDPAIKTAETRIEAGEASAPLATVERAAPAPALPFDHGYEPGSEQAIFLERLRASIPDAATGQGKKPLPWVAIATGAVGVFAILTVIVVVIAYTR